MDIGETANRRAWNDLRQFVANDWGWLVATLIATAIAFLTLLWPGFGNPRAQFMIFVAGELILVVGSWCFFWIRTPLRQRNEARQLLVPLEDVELTWRAVTAIYDLSEARKDIPRMAGEPPPYQDWWKPFLYGAEITNRGSSNALIGLRLYIARVDGLAPENTGAVRLMGPGMDRVESTASRFKLPAKDGIEATIEFATLWPQPPTSHEFEWFDFSKLIDQDGSWVEITDYVSMKTRIVKRTPMQ